MPWLDSPCAIHCFQAEPQTVCSLGPLKVIPVGASLDYGPKAGYPWGPTHSKNPEDRQESYRDISHTLIILSSNKETTCSKPNSNKV